MIIYMQENSEMYNIFNALQAFVSRQEIKLSIDRKQHKNMMFNYICTGDSLY